VARKVKRSDASAYLKKSREFLASARDSLKKGRFNAAGFDATQSMINANDALTVFFLEKRASTDHGEAVRLHVDVIKTIKDGAKRVMLRRSLDLRSEAGYLGKAISKKNSERLVKDAVSFLGWVEKYLKP
jgi:HEPN domain-containing protein